MTDTNHRWSLKLKWKKIKNSVSQLHWQLDTQQPPVTGGYHVGQCSSRQFCYWYHFQGTDQCAWIFLLLLMVNNIWFLTSAHFSACACECVTYYLPPTRPRVFCSFSASYHLLPLGLHSLRAKLLRSCLTLCDSMDCSPPGSSVHGILQAKILEWAAMPSSRGSSWPRDWTCVSYVSCIGRWVLYP